MGGRSFLVRFLPVLGGIAPAALPRVGQCWVSAPWNCSLPFKLTCWSDRNAELGTGSR